MWTEDDRRAAERDLRGTATRADWQGLRAQATEWYAYLDGAYRRALYERDALHARPATPNRERAAQALWTRMGRCHERLAHVEALIIPYGPDAPPISVALDEGRSRYAGDGWFGAIIRDALAPERETRQRARLGPCQSVSQTTLEALRYMLDYLSRWHISGGRRLIITLDAKYVVVGLRAPRNERLQKGERRAYLADHAVRRLMRDAPFAEITIRWVPRREHHEVDLLTRTAPMKSRRPWSRMTYHERRKWLKMRRARFRS